LIVADRCKHLIREIPGYSWDPKATEKGEDKPIKVADHSLDAARYAVASTETVWRPMLARRAA
jgi:phage terminase large subunit